MFNFNSLIFKPTNKITKSISIKMSWSYFMSSNNTRIHTINISMNINIVIIAKYIVLTPRGGWK